VNEDINDAITGHSGGNAVVRGYGVQDMVRRFGFQALSDAIEKVRYPGLDLTTLHWVPPQAGSSDVGLRASNLDSPVAPKEESPAISDRASSASVSVHP
jgi:hypothetical protein